MTLKHNKFQEYLLAVEKPLKCARAGWPVLSSYIGTTRTDLLHCPISAEIRIVLSK